MATLFVPSLRCPVCSHANDSDFRWLQEKDPILINKSGSVKVDLDSIDKRLQQLLNVDQATNKSKQEDSVRKELEAFCQPCRVNCLQRLFLPGIYVVFLFLRIRMVERRSTITVVNGACPLIIL